MIALSRDQQLQRWRERYARRHKEGKARLLDELCEQHEYSRKHAIKLLGDGLPKPTGQLPSALCSLRSDSRGRRADLAGRREPRCGKRLVAALPLWLPHYAKHFGSLLPAQRKLLGDVSAATLDRLLLARGAALDWPAPNPVVCCVLRFRCRVPSGMNAASGFWKPTAWRTVATVWPGTSSGV